MGQFVAFCSNDATKYLNEELMELCKKQVLEVSQTRGTYRLEVDTVLQTVMFYQIDRGDRLH